MSITKIRVSIAAAILAAAAFGTYITAQQGGSGIPGGSTFATQYKLNAVTFGGAGPGSSGQVWTSNGAGMAPSFQAAAGGGCEPAGMSGEVLFDDGSGGCDTDAGLSYSAAGDDLTVGGDVQAANLIATADGTIEDLEVGDELTLNGDAGTAAQVLTSNGMGMAPTWEDAGGGATAGTFTITWDDACTTSPTTSVNYTVVGNLVLWRLGALSGGQCTSDSQDFEATSTSTVPMAIRPAVEQELLVPRATNNGAGTYACVVVPTDGTVRVEVSDAAGGVFCSTLTSWTNSGTKSVLPATSSSIVYNLL